MDPQELKAFYFFHLLPIYVGGEKGGPFSLEIHNDLFGFSGVESQDVVLISCIRCCTSSLLPVSSHFVVQDQA